MSFLKILGVLLYEYVTFLKNLALKNIICSKNSIQNAKKKPFFMKELQELQQ